MKNIKKIVVLIILSGILLSTTTAQISNGGFENGSVSSGSCAITFSSLPTPWLHRNSCDLITKGTGAPNCIPHSGIAMAGLSVVASNNQNYYREYIIQAMSLTGGVEYMVEFWVQRSGGTKPIIFGALIGTTNYSDDPQTYKSGLTHLTPTIEANVGTNYGWQKVIGKYTPPTTGTYYITIGNFKAESDDELNYFNIDDVSVTPCTGTGSPTPVLTLNNTAFCAGSPVTANGGSSTNIDCYRWELYPQGSSSVLAQTQWATGTPSGTFSVNNFYPLVEDVCYTLKLAVNQGCAINYAAQNFCIENPLVNLALNAANPFCEGENFNITATGNNGWTYVWSTGQSGVGLKTISSTANTATTSYSVTVTTLAGCAATQNINIVVHPNTNVEPTTNGINNTGNFTYYVQANTAPFSFTLASFDAANEKVVMSLTSSLPSIATFNLNTSFHMGGLFNWPAANPFTPLIGPTNADVGVHTFNVTVTDEHACGALSKTYTVTINVVCQYCPLDIYYQDRHPNNKPLPGYTGAGRKIVAGNNIDNSQPNGTVETGTATVTFEAPQIIEMVTGFTAGPGFTALINPTTCTADCEICCEDWSGFTHEAIPNFFTPNGDGYFDVWTVLDLQHPFCAFSAQEFELVIKTPSGSTIYKLDEGTPSYCCPFTSPSVSCPVGPCFPSPQSDIFWDGLSNYSVFGFPTGLPAPEGTYFYVLKLKGCGNTQSYAGFITLLRGSARQGVIDSIPNFSELTLLEQEDLIRNGVTENKTANIDENKSSANQLLISPNPTKDKINISLSNNKIMQNGVIEIYTVQGILLFTKKVNSTINTIDVSPYATGTYFIKLTTNNNVFTKTFIKE